MKIAGSPSELDCGCYMVSLHSALLVEGHELNCNNLIKSFTSKNKTFLVTFGY